MEANISANEINNPQGQQENTLKENTITASKKLNFNQHVRLMISKLKVGTKGSMMNIIK